MKYIQSDNDLVIVLGTIPSLDNQELLNELSASSAKKVYLSPVEDSKFEVELFCKYEAGSEEGVIAILAKYLAKDLSNNLEEYFEELDDGYLSAETNIGEDEFEDIADMVTSSSNPLLIVGEDIVNHERVENIKTFLAILKKYTKLSLVSSIEFNEDETVPSQVEELKSFDGTVVLNYKAQSDEELNLLIGSRQFSIAAKSIDGQAIIVNFANQQSQREFKVDENLKGTIALMPIKDDTASYRYQVAKITKREVQ